MLVVQPLRSATSESAALGRPVSDPREAKAGVAVDDNFTADDWDDDDAAADAKQTPGDVAPDPTVAEKGASHLYGPKGGVAADDNFLNDDFDD